MYVTDVVDNVLGGIAKGMYIAVSLPLPGDKKRAVKWVNERRAELKLDPISELPKGTPGDPTNCVFSNALGGHHVDGLTVYGAPWKLPLPEKYVEGVHGRKLLPRYVRAHILLFDGGHLDELKGANNVEDLVIKPEPPTVYAKDSLTKAELEDISIQSEIATLEIRLEGLEASHAATSRDLRNRIRELETKVREQNEVEVRSY